MIAFSIDLFAVFREQKSYNNAIYKEHILTRESHLSLQAKNNINPPESPFSLKEPNTSDLL